MMVFLRQNLAFVATPKTGSTAVEMALRSKSEVIFAKARKHLPAQRYQARVRPFLDQTFQTSPQAFSVMRNPVEQLRSWYRYRHSGQTDTPQQSAAGMSFDDFVRGVVSDDPPPPCQIGSQFQFLCNGKGQLQVEHLFAYERQPVFRAWLEERFGETINLKPKNISPDVPAPLSPEVETALRKARAQEFALYEQVCAADGYLESAL